MTDFQIFISYRREGGDDLAGRISDNLKAMGYSVFFDVEAMVAGHFNDQILNALDKCRDVLVILPQNALDRCSDPEDWVRREIEYAIEKGKNIIPVMMRGFSFPKSLPEKMAELSTFEGVDVPSGGYFNAMMERIVSLLESRRPTDNKSQNNSDAVANAVRMINYGMYDKAIAALEEAMQTDISNADLYFYAAAALLSGKRPFLVPKATIEAAIRYLTVAIDIEEKGIYHFFLAYIKSDFHKKKMLRILPDCNTEAHMAAVCGTTEGEKLALAKLLRVDSFGDIG